MIRFNVQNIKVGETYRYKNLCELLGVERVEAQNKKVRQLEEFNRYFSYERPDYHNFKIESIHDEPLVGLENGYFYKTMYIPVKCSDKDYKYLLQCNKWSAKCWNALVEGDKKFHEENDRYMTRSELQTFVKNITPLHSAGNQHVYLKYYSNRDAMFRSIQANHEGSKSAKLPYKRKKYFTTGWNVYSYVIDYRNKTLSLAKKVDENGKKQKPVVCTFKTMPRYVVEVELIYKGKLYFAVKYKSPKTNEDIVSNNVAAIDFGEIHSISSIDNNGNALIITGRKLRSITRLRNKEQGKIKSKRAKLSKNSKQYKKYTHAIHDIGFKSDNQVLDCVHKISKLYLDYCIENKISKVYYGDLDSCTRGKHGKMSKFTNQKLRDWCYGLLTLQLENKLSRYGIEMIKISEAYTSQTCPHCENKHKPTGRNYECDCGYTQHRDLVGAMNILNFYEKDLHIERYENLKYLRIS